MQATLIDRYGPADRLRLAEVPVPIVGDGDLLVEVQAASVNPVDFKIRDGKLRPLLKFGLPLILCNDLAGVVAAVGAGVTRFKSGDAIYARLDKDRIGAFAQFALASESAAAQKPSSIKQLAASRQH